MTKKEHKKFEVEFLLVCDYAYTAEGGKLSLVGKFDIIFARNFPVSHPEMFIVASLVGPANSEHLIKLKIINSSGEELVPHNAPALKVKLSPTGTGNLLHRFLNFPIKEAGDYVISLYEADKKLATTKLSVIKTEDKKEQNTPN